MDSQRQNVFYARLVVFSVVLLGVAFGVKALVLQGATQVVSLGSAPALSGEISQSLIKAGADNSVPKLNKDFSISQANYFENHEWAVATIKSTSKESNGAFVVLQRMNGVYKIILGPGTAFPNVYLKSLPSDVGTYLYNQGAIYGITE